ncbi:nucleoside monophosphate kinase [Candidatus Saccharibacteria bacterium]|nr:nucleoside monophosphate kinase [Candidatus Saccharibacteria bacterium]
MIVILGAAGSGKSVQGQALAERHGWKWMSMGQLLRERKDPELEKAMSAGELVDYRVASQMIHDAAEEAGAEGKKAIYDGYPRSMEQLGWMIEKGDVEKVEGVIVLDVPKDELWRRLQERRREDDADRAVVEKRWKIFEQENYSIVEKLREHGAKIAQVSGDAAVEVVTDRIDQVLEEWGLINDVDSSDIERWDERGDCSD